MDRLLPCPFCGGEAEYRGTGGWHGAGCLVVKCPGCRHALMFRTAPEAIAAWNRRTLPAPAAGVALSDEQIEVELRWLRRNNGMDGMTSEYRDRLVAQHFLTIAASPDPAPPHEGEPDAILKRGRYAVGGTYWDVLVLNQDLPDGTPLYAHPAPAQGERDAKRFAWYFSDKPKGDWLATYLDGVRAGWTIDEWRAAIDAAISSEGSKKP